MPGAETFHASADAYDRHVGRYSDQLASALIAFAGIEPGMRAVDVGCGPGALTAALARVRFGPLVVSAHYSDFEDLWSPFPTGIAPSGAFCASLEADRRDELHNAYRRRLGVGDGAFELTARAWAVAGTVPGWS